MIEQETRSGVTFRPYILNSFMEHTRLNKEFLKGRSQVDPQQVYDISIRGCPAQILYLSLVYHLKFPRYIVNKLDQLKGSAAHKTTDLRYLIVLVDSDSLTAEQQFMEIQKLALTNGYSVMPAWSCEDVKSTLEQLRNTYLPPNRIGNNSNLGSITQKQQQST